MKRSRCVVAFLLLAVQGAVAAPPVTTGDPSVREAAVWKPVEELWYVVEMGGGRAGSMLTRVESDGERYRTDSKVTITIRRGTVSTTIEISSSFVETAAGEPVLMRSVQDMGMQPAETEWRFEGDRVVLTTRQGGRESVRETKPPEPGWLTPMAIHRYWMEQLRADAKIITYETVDAQSGLEPITIRHERVGQEQYELAGKTIPVTVWQTTTTILPVAATEKYSPEGKLVYQEVDIGMGRMVTRLASKAEALGDTGQAAPELLVQTFVQPSRPIPKAHEAVTATLRLAVREGVMPDLPSAGAQRVDRGAGGAGATLTININESLPAPEGDINNGVYLESSSMVGADDPLVNKLAARAVRTAGDDRMRQAEAMRAFVHRYVNSKGLDTAFATASETAALRTGDCSEHAVLLCAMLRAAEIPARVAIGLVYADSFLAHDDIFGWHMWTQALIDDRWIDLDATLPVRHHAGHVLTATTSLSEGDMSTALGATLLLMGNLEIEVVEVGYEKK